MYDLNSPFDIEQHKKTYINYCEVCISREGVIEYAIPSHQSYLERIGASQRHMSIDKFRLTCPPDMYTAYMEWLVRETGYVVCWTIGYMYESINRFQQHSLDKLISNNLVEDKRVYV